MYFALVFIPNKGWYLWAFQIWNTQWYIKWFIRQSFSHFKLGAIHNVHTQVGGGWESWQKRTGTHSGKEAQTWWVRMHFDYIISIFQDFLNHCIPLVCFWFSFHILTPINTSFENIKVIQEIKDFPEILKL